MIFPFDREPLGMIMVLLSGVFSVVLKIWIAFTLPMNPCASITSPTLNGLKSIISTPPAKFAMLPCNARPTAKPAAPRMAMKDVICTPTMEITEMKSALIESFISELDKSNGDYEKVQEIKEKMENLKQRKKFEMPIKVSYIQNYFNLAGERYFVYLPLLSGFNENKEECVITLHAQNNTKIKLDSSADSEIIHSGQKIKVYPEDFQAVFVKVSN